MRGDRSPTVRSATTRAFLLTPPREGRPPWYRSLRKLSIFLLTPLREGRPYSGKVTSFEAHEVLHAINGRQNGSQADTKSQSIHSIKTTTISLTDVIRVVNSTNQSILPDNVDLSDILDREQGGRMPAEGLIGKLLERRM